MDKAKKITILGAGAIGCTVAAQLILAGFHRLSLIARGENLKILRERGIEVDDLTGQHQLHPFQVTEHSHEVGVQDIVFIATKASALESLITILAPLLGADTIVIPLMNGIPFWYFYDGKPNQQSTQIKSVDPTGALIQHFPIDQLLGAVVFITAELKGHGRVYSSNPYLLIVGEPNNSMSPRLEQLKDLFAETSIELRLSTQIRDQIWTKVMANLSSNPLSVITGATLKDIYSHPNLAPIAMQMTQEIRQVAASYGARIEIDPDTFLKLGSQMGEVRTSMWYDYQKHQALELASIAHAVLELAEKYQCAMPVTQQICQLTHYLSENFLRLKTT